MLWVHQVLISQAVYLFSNISEICSDGLCLDKRCYHFYRDTEGKGKVIPIQAVEALRVARG
jgi:hypothetical protein